MSVGKYEKTERGKRLFLMYTERTGVDLSDWGTLSVLS